MKKIALLLMAAICSVGAFAQVNITKVDKVQPTDEIFMEMAVTAAQKAVADGLKPAGAVVILNGAWKGTGLPSEGSTPEENAIARTGRSNLSGAKIYTVNEPTAAALNAIMKAGVSAVYFVNSSAAAVSAGVNSADEYNSDLLNSDLTPVAVYQLTYAPAADLLK